MVPGLLFEASFYKVPLDVDGIKLKIRKSFHLVYNINLSVLQTGSKTNGWSKVLVDGLDTLVFHLVDYTGKCITTTK